MTDERNNEALDRATSARLGKLRSTPVELGGLEARLRAEVTPPGERVRRSWTLRLRPLHAVAATLTVAALTVALTVSLASRPVMAEAQLLATLYADPHAASHGTKDGQTTPDGFDAAMAAMDCCVHKVGRARLTSVTFELQERRVTLMVADAKDVKAPPSSPSMRLEGQDYYVQSSGELNMVMTTRDGTWLCLTGPLPAEALAKQLAATPKRQMR